MTQAEKEQENGKEKEKEREKEKEKEQQRGVKRPIAPPAIPESAQEVRGTMSVSIIYTQALSNVYEHSLLNSALLLCPRKRVTGTPRSRVISLPFLSLTGV